MVVWVTLSAIEDTGSEAPLQCTDKLQMRLQLAPEAAGPEVCVTFVSQSMLGQPLCQMYLSSGIGKPVDSAKSVSKLVSIS